MEDDPRYVGIFKPRPPDDLPKHTAEEMEAIHYIEGVFLKWRTDRGEVGLGKMPTNWISGTLNTEGIPWTLNSRGWEFIKLVTPEILTKALKTSDRGFYWYHVLQYIEKHGVSREKVVYQGPSAVEKASMEDQMKLKEQADLEMRYFKSLPFDKQQKWRVQVNLGKNVHVIHGQVLDQIAANLAWKAQQGE